MNTKNSNQRPKSIFQKLFKSGFIFDQRNSLTKAVDWIKNHRVANSGISVSDKTKTVTPEVTGYIIASLYNVGEKELAIDLAKWEASVQLDNGGFLAPGSKHAYTFDTAQIMRGFLAVLPEYPAIKSNLARAAEFMISQVDHDGRMITPDYSIWEFSDGSKFSEYCYLYAINPIRKAGEVLGERKFIDQANKALNYYKSKKDLVEFKSELGTLSHIFGYMMEGLAELGEHELAKKGLDQAIRLQKTDGSIPAYPGVEWVCATGVAQLGIAAWLVGYQKEATLMLNYLEKIQNKTGGFYGGYGKNVKFFPLEEISWADKFFIDLHLLVRGHRATTLES